jgi:hypothetical protein
MYKDPSIIYGTGAAILSKTNFGPTGHHHPLQRVCTVPSASVIFKCILEAMFCEGVQHLLRFYLDHLNCVKMAAFQFCIQSGKQRRVGCVRDNSHVGFGKKKFPGKKGSVRWCAVMIQQPILSSPSSG